MSSNDSIPNSSPVHLQHIFIGTFLIAKQASVEPTRLFLQHSRFDLEPSGGQPINILLAKCCGRQNTATQFGSERFIA